MKTILLCILIMTYGQKVGFAVAEENVDHPNNNKVFIITIDGLRWQELFFGADPSIIQDTTERYALNSIDEGQRRRKLMPFLWSVVAKEGQIFGNRRHGNKVNVSNIYALSYPGYNEMFTGSTDLTIFNNRRIRNKNITLFEHLNRNSFFHDKIASFTSWDMFSYIFNKDRSKLHVNSRCNPAKHNCEAAADHGSNRNDEETFAAAKEYIINNSPRLVHIGLGGTDTYAHKKNYRQYLEQAKLADSIIGQLWRLVQSSPFYKQQTTFIITTDHGRGAGRHNWHKHGMFIKGSSETWMALLGNGVRQIGEVTKATQLYQRQVAGTIAHFLNIRSFNNYSLPLSYFEPIQTDVAIND